MKEKDLNQRVAEHICTEGRWKGRTIQLGDYVALLDGNVVAVEKDLDTALRALRALDSDPSRGMIFEVGPPVTDVILEGLR